MMSLAEVQPEEQAGSETVVDGRRRPVASPLESAASHCVSRLLDDRWPRESVIGDLRRHGLDGVPDLVATATRAARILGERWVADTCSFGDVTLGLHRLTLLLIDIEALPDPARRRLHGGRALLAPVADDQHSFGLATVGLALRRAGWDVSVDLSGDPAALVAAARRGVDLVGLSVGHDRAVATATGLIARLRAAAPRPATIAVGGPMLERLPDLARLVGADLATTDGFALAAAIAAPGRAWAA